jgi:SNF2 family DNA or RNA helicase
MDPNHKGYFVNALDRLNLLRRVVGNGKARIAVGYCREFLANTDRKLVIYAHHHAVVNYLKEELDREYGCSTITGKVSSKVRQQRIKHFQERPDLRVMLITSAGGQGIDLFGIGSNQISDILFVEREWSPSLEEQAEARLHRIGQAHAVEATYLVARSTVDTMVDRLIDTKRRVLNDIMGMADIEVSIVEDLLDTIR